MASSKKNSHSVKRILSASWNGLKKIVPTQLQRKYSEINIGTSATHVTLRITVVAVVSVSKNVTKGMLLPTQRDLTSSATVEIPAVASALRNSNLAN